MSPKVPNPFKEMTVHGRVDAMPNFDRADFRETGMQTELLGIKFVLRIGLKQYFSSEERLIILHKVAPCHL